MKQPLSISKELLNAFVDDELDTEERQTVLNAQLKDPHLVEMIAELRMLKDMVKAARPQSEILDMPVRLPKKRRLFSRWFAAASVLMMLFSLTASTAWYMRGEAVIARDVSQPYTNVTSLLQTQAAGEELKLVLHITHAGHDAALLMFAELEELLAHAQAGENRLRVQVVASGQGIRLLQEGVSPYSDRIHFISTHYDTVEFVACQRSMLRQARVENTEISILPEALITHSGPELIKRRQRQGWATIAI
ncbi:hypothetical protein [Sulfuriflexus mobilis]|uniref:hypothetical protein n=1 Tax=Sulfuriflexus mobilis TaxID=1811807 RepID=UPI000F82449C|nr:hypothetical protein [Sulfuriflexus mobilis]